MSNTEKNQKQQLAIKKYALIIAGGWTLLVVTLVLWTTQIQMRNAQELIRNEANAHLNKDQAFRSWAAVHGGVYVPPTAHTPPNPILSFLPNRDIVTTEGKKLTLMNPAYMVRQLMEKFEELYGIKGRITSLKPLHPKNEPDEWECLALESFELGKTEANEFTEIEGELYLRLMRPMMTEKSCLKCHGHQGYKEGDIHGGVGVSVPAAPFYAKARSEIVEHAIAIGLLWLLGLAALTLSARHMRRRVRERNRIEEMLLKTEEHNRYLIESIRDIIYTISPDGVITSLSQAFESVTGWMVTDWIGKSIEQIMHPDDIPSTRKLFTEYLEGTIPFVHELRVKAKSGEYLNIEFQDTIVRSDGIVVEIIGVARDITERKQVEKALQESEAKYKGIVESSHDVIMLTDLDGVISYISPACKQVLGYDAEALVGRQPWIIHPDDLEKVKDVFCNAMQGESGSDFEYRINTGTNETKWISHSWSPIINDNQLQLIVSVVSDITERKQAEKKLSDSEARLNEAQRFTKIGNWDLDLVTNDLYWSDEVYRMFNIEPQRFGATYQAFLDNIHPDDRALVNKAYTDSVKNRTPYDIVHRLLLKDGSLKIVNERCETFYDDNGKAIRSIGTVQDITKLKRAEKALRESEEKFRRYITYAPDAIFVTNAQGRYLEANQAAYELTGYSGSELTSMGIPDIIDPKTQTAVLNDFEELKKTGRVKTEFRLKRKDGTIIWSSVDAVALSEDRFMGFCSDISETKRLQKLESRAARLETAGTIAGQVAHDLNNLLAPIMAYPEFIHDELPRNHKAHKYLDTIELAAKKIADINQDLLTLGRRGHYNLEVINLSQIVIQASQEMESRTNTVTIKMDLCEDLMNIKGGAAQISRMLTNLLVNAQDAMQNIGTVTIKTENYYADETSIVFGRVPKGEYVRLTITDNGCGIPDDIIEKVFDPFFSTKTTDKKRGSGLGLSVVDAVIKDHNGYLDLSSKVGHGTSFYLYFPVFRDDSKDADCVQLIGGTETVLVIDDDDIQREVSSQLLMKLGYKVSSVKSGEKAIEFLRENSQDLLILDMVMPGGIDGTDTYRQILEINPHQKAIILSGFAESDRVTEAQKLGAGVFVRKPVTKKTLATAVRAGLERQVKTVTC